MNQSPYAPPQSSVHGVTADNPENLYPGLPDMSSFSISELRELLSNPDLYTPEAVHASARELARRSAVPRYYTRVYSHHLGKNFSVTRKLKFDQVGVLQHIFSESNLRRYCFLIAIFQLVSSALVIVGTARIFKLSTSDILIKNASFLFTSLFAAGSTMLMSLFFFSLHRTLSSRSIHKI